MERCLIEQLHKHVVKGKHPSLTLRVEFTCFYVEGSFRHELRQLTKAAIKLDLRGAIPVFIHFSDGKLHDANVLDMLTR